MQAEFRTNPSKIAILRPSLQAVFAAILAVSCSSQEGPQRGPGDDRGDSDYEDPSKNPGDADGTGGLEQDPPIGAQQQTLPQPGAPGAHLPTAGGSRTTYVLLHGLAGNAAAWEILVERVFQNRCPVLRVNELDDNVPATKCYRYNFVSRKDAAGNEWGNGDGATYVELGDEVGALVQSVKKKSNPTSIVFVAHSRGGLAARGYLQREVDKTLKFGLLTLGTPHRGSPFGRVKSWMEGEGIGLGDIPVEGMRFLLSPSTGYLASSLEGGQPKEDEISKAISELEKGVSELANNAQVLGQIYSRGYDLGENLVPGIDFLGDSPFNPARFLPGNFGAMRDYILDGANKAWIDGDNIVPKPSAQMTEMPGLAAVKGRIFSKELKNISHTDAIQFDVPIDSNPNDGLTGQSGAVELLLGQMTTNKVGFEPFGAR